MSLTSAIDPAELPNTDVESLSATLDDLVEGQDEDEMKANVFIILASQDPTEVVNGSARWTPLQSRLIINAQAELENHK